MLNNNQLLLISRKFFSNKRNLYILIIGLGFLIYAQVLFFGLTYLDDSIIILNNQNFFQNPKNIIQLFNQPDFISPQFYRPVLHLVFFIGALFFNSSIFIFHFTTILVHLINGILIFLLFSRFGYKKDTSLMFSLIFIVHPVLTQSVAWIPGITDSLWFMFAILSFIFLIKATKTSNINHFAAHSFFLILAFLSKETAVILPAIFIFYILFICDSKRKSIIAAILLLNWSAITTLWFALRKNIIGNPVGVSFGQIKQSIIIHIPAIISYIGKILFPFNLSVLPHISDLSQSVISGFIGLIFIFIALVFSKNKRLNFVIFGVLWFIVALLPSFIISKIVHESRVYFPIIGFFIILLEIDWIKKIDFSKIKPLIIFAIIILFLSIANFLYAQTFKTPISFWQNAVRTSPHSSLARLNLGVMYFFSNRFSEAEFEYKKAIELNPKEQIAHNNLGFLYFTQKKYQDAEKEYKKEIAINPNYDVAYYNMGLLYYEKEDIETAKKFLKHALSLNPKNIYAAQSLKKISNHSD